MGRVKPTRKEKRQNKKWDKMKEGRVSRDTRRKINKHIEEGTYVDPEERKKKKEEAQQKLAAIFDRRREEASQCP